MDWKYNSVLNIVVILSVNLVGCQGLECFSCPHEDSQNSCTQTTTCPSGQLCMLRVLGNNGTKSYFETRCATQQECPDSLLQPQGSQCLIQCCDETRCNNGCKSTTTSTSTTTTPAPGVAAATDPPLTCPHGYYAFQKSCYMFAKWEMDMEKAKLFCGGYNSYLVHVDSQEESEFIARTLQHLHRGASMVYWIGINDIDRENDWRFTDTGEAAPFFNWADNEPNNMHSLGGNLNSADCAVISTHHGYKWTDSGCSAYETAYPICEMKNPADTGTILFG